MENGWYERDVLCLGGKNSSPDSESIALHFSKKKNVSKNEQNFIKENLEINKMILFARISYVNLKKIEWKTS